MIVQDRPFTSTAFDDQLNKPLNQSTMNPVITAILAQCQRLAGEAKYLKENDSSESPKRCYLCHTQASTQSDLLQLIVNEIVDLVKANPNLFKNASPQPTPVTSAVFENSVASAPVLPITSVQPLPKLPWIKHHSSHSYITPIPTNSDFEIYLQAQESGRVSLIVYCQTNRNDLVKHLRDSGFTVMSVGKTSIEKSFKSEANNPEDALRLYECCNSMQTVVSRVEQEKSLCLEMIKAGRWTDFISLDFRKSQLPPEPLASSSQAAVGAPIQLALLPTSGISGSSTE